MEKHHYWNAFNTAASRYPIFGNRLEINAVNENHSWMKQKLILEINLSAVFSRYSYLK